MENKNPRKAFQLSKTKLLYLEDFLSLTCEARVVEIAEENNKTIVMLDATIFYPQGGGQPYDTGGIESGASKFLVGEARFVDGVVWHIGIFKSGSFAVGDTVVCRIDAERRMLHARIHSAGHLVDKAVIELNLPWRPGKGFHFPQGPYVEYEGALDGIDKEKLKIDIESLCNRYVRKGGRTEIIFMTREEMKKKCRYTPDFPAEKSERARVVIHDGFMMPCGGTPVANMAEIGEITIRKIKQERDRIRVGYNLVERQ